MYMITFIELGRGALNSIFARKVSFFFILEVPQRERDASNLKIQQQDL